MSETILSRLAFDFRAAPFQQSPFQAQVDGLVGRFVEEAASPTTLGALMAGGMAYRLTRVGVLGLGSSNLLRPVSAIVGLGSEVSAYELTSRSLLSLSGDLTNPNLWRWEGAGGWRAGLLSSAVSFWMLKAGGALGREQNLFFQHALQSTAMVAGHQTTGLLGLTPRPSGTLAEQFLHAEITNLQLGAGMSLAHAVAPGVHALERGLDLSASQRPGPLSEGFFPEFSQRMAVAVASRPSPSTVLEENPNLLMSTGGGDPPDGSDKPGRGREDSTTDPSRSRTLPGLEPRRPSQTGLSRMIFRVEGFAETVATLEAQRREGVPFEDLLKGIQSHFRSRGGSLVIHLSGGALSPLEQAELRVDLNRLFREANAPEGTAVAIYSSTQVKAVVFTRRGGFLHIEEGKVKVVAQPLQGASGESKTQEPPRTMTLHGLGTPPRSPGASGVNLGAIPQASDSSAIENLLDRVLAQDDPTIHFTGALWTHVAEASRIVEWLEKDHVLPREKTLTILVDNPPGLRVTFAWGTESHDRDKVWWKTERMEAARTRQPSAPAVPVPTESTLKPAEKRRPTVPPPPPPPPPPPTVSRGRPIVEKRGPDERIDSINCGTSSEVFSALRGLLNPPKGNFVPAPAIRMVSGHLTPSDLSSLAKVVGEQDFRWPEGYKILIHWGESPSGVIHLQRRGDHVTVEVKSLAWKKRNFLFLREMPRTGQWGVYEPSQVRFYPQTAGSDYESESEDEIRRLAGEIWTDESSSPFHMREEGSSFRGGTLARLAVHLLKNRPLQTLGLSSQEWGGIEGIHTQLERAYTFFDFDTLRIFAERVGEDRMRGYRSAVEQFNQRAPAEGKPLLVPLEEMAVDMPGSYVIPAVLHLRRPFLQSIFHGSSTGRSPRENLAFLNDPVRLGEAYRFLFENYIRVLLPEMEALRNRAKQAGLANIPLKAKEGLDPELIQLRDQFLARFQDLVDFRRVLGEGWGNFKIDFLRTAFHENRSLSQLYRTLYQRVSQLDVELQRLVNLPSFEEIKRLMRASSP